VLFDELMSVIAGRFGRAEPRRTAREFVLGLLSPVERKNCWWLAEQAGHRDPQAMQRLLRTAAWDADAVRDDLRGFVAARLGAAGGVLICDETGFLKKGTGSVGVQRQYTGTAGRIENSQVGVFLSYACPRGRALIDRRVYLPKSWTGDPSRRAAAGVPAEVEFAAKPELALEMITDAVAARMPASWVASEPFPSSLCRVDLQGVDGFGELPGPLGAAAGLPEDAPGLELGIRPLAGSAEPRVRGWLSSGIPACSCPCRGPLRARSPGTPCRRG
jgi:hypothetical protein